MDTSNKALLIDADCFKYIFSWWHRDKNDVEDFKKDIRIRIKEFCSYAQVAGYVGVFGTSPTFRVDAYKYKPYKGNRPPKQDCVIRWEPVVEQYCVEELGFLKVMDMEADDYIGFMMRTYPDQFICSSPDKDLLQIPGSHLQFKDKEVTTDAGTAIILQHTIHQISELDAAQSFWMQMLMGDTTDNVAGIPGMGEKKAKEKLKEHWDDSIQMGIQVYEQYKATFGPHYGPIIYKETYTALYAGPVEPIEQLLISQNLRSLTIQPLGWTEEMGESPIYDSADLNM